MISFEEAGAVLDEAVETLPEGIFERLNGGINLLPDASHDDDGLLTMGMYIVDHAGRRVEIYYGSFLEALPDADEETCRRELVDTLKHELTHHLENLAGDRSLEIWDEQHKEELLNGIYGEPLAAKSVLFISIDDAGLGPAAAAMFSAAAEGILCGSAGLEPADEINPKAVMAAGAGGWDISAYRPRAVTAGLLEEYEAVLCLELSDADALIERFPEQEDKILCLGPRDISPPRLNMKSGWASALARVEQEIGYLVRELLEGESDDNS